MSKVVASDVPTGRQVISCTAYSNRVVNLVNGTANNNIIGWPFQDTSNEVWTFIKQGTVGSEYKISTTVDKNDGATVYASSVDPVSGDRIFCTYESATVYNVVPLTEDEGNYRISVTASDGTVLYWTLDNDDEGTADRDHA